ncbi:MAG TPA: transketolase family protein [Clostridiaceae bacterium]|nr:transketolase family protein [Clostridiaceae bacterium]
MEMRAVFASELDRMMESDERIVVIDSDLSKANGTLFLRNKYPERAFDVGVAEQNMASVAAGLASYGFIPFITSFCPFATRRICDQIAISIAYAKQNVKIVGTDPGISAELNGGTHMSMEDIGVVRSIPSMVIFEPVDAVQLKKSMPKIVEYDGPVYLRLFRKAQPQIFNDDYEFDLFKADVIQEGKDVTIAASGIMLGESLRAGEILRQKGINAEIINVHTIKPIDSDTILKSVAKTGCIVTAENHNIIGGLRSAIAEVICEKCQVPLRSVGVEDIFGEVGTLEELKIRFGLTAENIAAKALEAVEAKK